MIVRNLCNERDLSWWPWTQTPTWTLCSSWTIQITSLCMPTLHLSWSFLMLQSITRHSSTLLGVTLFAQLQAKACSSLVCQFFGSTIYLVSQIVSFPGVEISYALVCWHRCDLCLVSVIFCLLQLGPSLKLLAQLDGLQSLRQQCYIFRSSKHVALRVCFIEQLIQDGIISANQCPTTLQIPDIRTKALSREPFKSLTDQLLSDRHVGSKWVSFGPSYVWERIRPVSYQSTFMLRTEVRNYLPR